MNKKETKINKKEKDFKKKLVNDLMAFNIFNANMCHFNYYQINQYSFFDCLVFLRTFYIKVQIYKESLTNIKNQF